MRRIGGAGDAVGADAEVVARARRRHFSNADKRRILAAADRCTKPGEIGALMRREGVYSSSLSTWRRQREAAELAALAPQKRGPKADPHRAEALHIAQLTREQRTAQEPARQGAAGDRGPKKTCCPVGPYARRQRRADLMAGVHELAPALGSRAACRALGPVARRARARSQARLHRAALVGPRAPRAARPRPPLALDTQESQLLLDTLNSERFVDTAPAAVHATLLDEGRYLGSVRTMYRLLAANGGCARAAQPAHPSGLCQARAAGHRRPTRSGPGTSPSSRGRRSGPASTST